MKRTRSKDGTAIAFEWLGKGPGLIIVGGALSTRSFVVSEIEAAGDAGLARHFTVFAYDRRGRGESGDATLYAAEREVEDIDALIAQAGGSAFVFGHSSGAVLALEAARLLPNRITKLALYEPPFLLDGSRPPLPEGFQAQLERLVASGRRGDAVEYFMTAAVGTPGEIVAQMRNSPPWPGFEKDAHTLVYEGILMGDTLRGKPSSIKRWASVSVPTLVMDGGASPEFMHHAVEALVDVLPNAQHRRFPGLGHAVPQEVLTPALVEFFLG